MSLGLSASERRTLFMLPPADQCAVLADMSAADLLQLDADFELWAAQGQIAPSSEGWRVWLMLAGRGFGKTRAGAEWIHRLARGRGLRMALVGASIDDARRVMIEGASGLLVVAARDHVRLRWEPSAGRLTWPSGSIAELYSGANPDGLRGPEHHFAWCDELAKWSAAEATWDNLQMGLRGGTRPRALVTTTPKPLALLKRMMEDPRSITTRGRTTDNLTLPDNFVAAMAATYGGTRQGRQELDGEYMEEAEGSLWPRALIARCRLDTPLRRGSAATQDARGAGFDRIVVGVDPPAGAGASSDACGIVVAGRAGDKLFVLEDASVQGLSPEGWSNRVAAAAARWGAGLVVAEANNGGAMVRSVLLAAEAGLKVKLVHAAKGKVARAEPVALRFEAGRAFFAGVFAELEAELVGLTAGGGYDGPGASPDRADAMVWALTELAETRSGVPRVVRL